MWLRTPDLFSWLPHQDTQQILKIKIIQKLKEVYLIRSSNSNLNQTTLSYTNSKYTNPTILLQLRCSNQSTFNLTR